MLKRILLILYVVIIGTFVTFKYSNDRVKNNINIKDNQFIMKNKDYLKSLDGILAIPSVDIYAPLNISTGINDVYDVMGDGIAYDSSTGLPNEGREIVLMGHRENELYKLENIEIGDNIYLVINGQAANYSVTDYQIINANDSDQVYSESSTEELRLFTCYPLAKYTPVKGRLLIRSEKNNEMTLINE